MHKERPPESRISLHCFFEAAYLKAGRRSWAQFLGPPCSSGKFGFRQAPAGRDCSLWLSRAPVNLDLPRDRFLAGHWTALALQRLHLVKL